MILIADSGSSTTIWCMADHAGKIRDASHPVFPNASIAAEIDLLGSACALLGCSPRFVAILGTNTSLCLYNGVKITDYIDFLGFMQGDEVAAEFGMETENIISNPMEGLIKFHRN